MSRRAPIMIISRYALAFLILLTGWYLLFVIGVEGVIEWVRPFSDRMFGIG